MDVRRTWHVRDRSLLRDVDVDDVERCLTDADVIRSVGLRSGAPGGLQFERETPRGRLIVIARQEADMIVVITIFWDLPPSADRRRRR